MHSISDQIWALKYRQETSQGISEQSIHDTWNRVAKALASVETEEAFDQRYAEFRDAMDGFQVLPAGRILATAGTPQNQTMINTFVMGAFDGSIEGITRVAHEAGVTMQMGGGIGYDFSKIGPKGASLPHNDGTSPGPLSAMEVCDAVSGLLTVSARRGAMMATMRCDHPDIREFITAKSDRSRFRNFNLSVMVTDQFMRAVRLNDPWALKWRGQVVEILLARELWDLIMQQTYNAAEPGVLFIDRINADNPLHYLEEISATNSCAEQPLPPNGSAPLASINLARLVRSPFEKDACLDLEKLRSLTATTVRMLDNVIEVSNYPTDAQAHEARSKRRIGVGVTGTANALAMIGEVYGSASAASTLETWMRELQHAATSASVELAKERGAFDGFCDQYCKAARCTSLDPKLQQAIRTHGVRNALTTSIAPTGTISMLAGNVSSGIEPTFALSYDRKIKLSDGTEVVEKMEDYAVRLYREKFGPDAELPPQFVTAMSLDPQDHVMMQAAAQRWVESSISKTVNCPKNIDFEKFKDVYEEAYQAGCKGCTTYRPNDITGSVLSVENTANDTKKAAKPRKEIKAMSA